MIEDRPEADAEWAGAQAAARAVKQHSDDEDRSGSASLDAMDATSGPLPISGGHGGGAGAGGGEQPPSPGQRDDSIALMMGSSADDVALGGALLAHADSRASAELAGMAVDAA